MAADLPLALRRTPRRRVQHGVSETPRTPAPASQRKPSRASVVRKPATTSATAKTAGRAMSRSKAGVPESASVTAAGADDASDDSITLVDDADDSITALDFDIPISSSRRSSSGVGKRKRRPSVTSPSKKPAIKRTRRQTGSNDNENNSASSVVHILPIRTQILDDHIKRRIRRNGLSAEMNEAYGEKRARRERTLAELRRARDELRSRDAEIERLRELTALFDGNGDHSHHRDGEGEEEASRVQDLERELSRLREQVMGRRRGDDHDVPLSSSPPVVRGDDDDWGMMGGMSDGGSDAEGDFEDEFGESSVAELESGGTPEQHRHHRQQQQFKGKRPAALHLHGPTLTPPSTSPAKLPSSPVRQIHSSGSSSAAEMSTHSACDAGVQAAAVSTDAALQVCTPDPGMYALRDELNTLRAEVSSLNDTLSERDSLQARMGEKLSQHKLPSSPSSAQDDTVVDQDVELQLDIVLQDLAEKTNRLAELSSLLMGSPTDGPSTTDNKGEATAGLASALHSVRQALGDLDPNTPLPPAAAPTLALAADRLRELDTTLKRRTADLSDRDAALEAKDEQLAAATAQAKEKDARAASLEADVAHLGQTIASLRDAVADLQATSASQQADLDDARDAALQQGAAAAEAEARLAEAVAKLAALGTRLSEREDALRGREGEVETLRGALAEARATVARLREGAAREKGAARDAVRAMRAQMVAALKVGEGFLGEEGVAKEEEGVDVGVGVVGAGVDGMDKTARGRSDDSGLGLDGEEPQLV
ncbi:hypothetical protein INS49_013637 [Diaporthe citri]|uniref:uncharacterized protein n=1 Tax=Diaporthe citri TaxID=83186 RepID=UPI001C7ECEA3|nr:uncharacterized protein INS49_013637 [Diaporthe citri]KAG6357758.1 hypothetical protein INS49_013637 [Diaporthe citri]